MAKVVSKAHHWVISLKIRKPAVPIKIPPIVVEITTIVLQPFSNDFLFSPTIIDVERIPKVVRPAMIKIPKTVKTIPAPIKTSIIPKIINDKNAKPGENLSLSINC